MVFRLLLLGIASGLWVTPLLATLVQAQVTPDGTLNTTVTQSGLNYTITNGTSAGTNLYHSFGQFSIPRGGSATFNLNATPNITTIFSRVTGGSVSSLDGAIRTINSTSPVSLFLINPAGIIFGANASLNISGSFVGTTANSIKFADGTEFSAIAPSASPLLTVSVPIGLQIGPNPGNITVQGAGHRLLGGNFSPLDRSQNPSGLEVGAGQTLALIGGAVNFGGGIAAINGGGHLEIGSVSEGQVRLNATEQGWVGDYSAVRQFNDIHLAQRSLLDDNGSNGSIQIQGRNISLSEGSAALIQNFGVQPSGGIAVHATGLLKLTGITPDGSAGSFIRSDNLGMGQSGDIHIAAAQLSIQNGATIRTDTFSSAPGGNVIVNVLGAIAIDGFAPANPVDFSQIVTITFTAANAGNLTVSTDGLRLLNNGSIASVSFSSGQTGILRVNAQDSIEIAGFNPFTLSPSAFVISAFSSGNANNMFVNTSRLVIRDGGLVGSSTLATGSAGKVTINASQSVEIQGGATGSILPSRIVSTAEIIDPTTQAVFSLPAIPSGNAGSLTINTPSLHITDGAYVTVKNEGPGSAGNLQVNAGSLFLDNQGSITASTASGNGGNIRLNLKEALLMQHSSFLSATALGAGDGGNITITAPILLGLENSDIIANAVKGSGGNIQITTQGIFGLKYRPQLTPQNDITASSQFGVSGNVQINNLTVDPSTGIVQLPAKLVDPSQHITTGCNAQGSKFVATGRGGLPPDPSDAVESDRPWSDVRDVSPWQQLAQPVATTPPAGIIEATGLSRTIAGESVLIALPAATSTSNVVEATCAKAIAP